MTQKTLAHAAGYLFVIAALSVPVAAQTGPRTPWGDPDIQGTWTTDDTIGVPIQRPPALGNKLFLTDEDLAQQAARQAEARRAAQAASPAGAAPAPIGPPDHWGENASKPVRQTSFVVDPPDGRIPTVTAKARSAPRAATPAASAPVPSIARTI